MNDFNVIFKLNKLGDSAMQAAKAATELKKVLMSDAEDHYRISIGRVPGSNKTKRLRKKRFKALSSFCEYYW